MKTPAKPKPRSKKSWNEKLDQDKGLPKIVPMPERMEKTWGKGTLVIPKPREVCALIAKVPKRKLMTVTQLSQRVAIPHKATLGCPITTGIFAWMCAYAADEEEEAGKKKIAPYWRILKAGGELNPRYPGGIENLQMRLEAEGHTVFQKGKRFFVKDYEKSLVKD